MSDEKISETDLLVYMLAVERGYHDLLELYGMFHESAVCPHCKKNTGAHFKLVKEVVSTFGSGSIRVPRETVLRQLSRDIAVWKGLNRCAATPVVNTAEEFARRYRIKLINVYKIRQRVQAAVEKFMAMKRIFKRRHS